MTNLRDYLNDLVEETVKEIDASMVENVYLPENIKERLIDECMDGVKKLMGIDD